MLVATYPAFALGSQKIVSKKTNRTYYKVNLVMDGNYASFFMSEQKGLEVTRAKQFEQIEKTHNPQPCEATISISFGEKGTYVNLEQIK